MLSKRRNTLFLKVFVSMLFGSFFLQSSNGFKKFSPCSRSINSFLLRSSQLFSSSGPQTSNRPTSNGVSLDVNLIASDPDLVMKHLLARRSNSQLENDLKRISDLRSKRNALIIEGDAAKGKRKTLSAQIGQLMKEKREAEVTELKALVEEANAIADGADAKRLDLEAEIDSLFSLIPNLLDDRYVRKIPPFLVFNSFITIIR